MHGFASAGGPTAISALGSSASVGTIVLSNANNVSFGMAGSTITASAGGAAGVTIKYWENGIIGGGNAIGATSQLEAGPFLVSTQLTSAHSATTNGILSGQRVLIPFHINATRLDMLAVVMIANNRVLSSNSANDPQALPLGTWSITPGDYLLVNNLRVSFSTGGPSVMMSRYAGIYTMNGSTASLLSSASSALTVSDGFGGANSTASIWIYGSALQPVFQTNIAQQRIFMQTAPYFAHANLATQAMPNSIHLSNWQITGSGTSQFPYVRLIGS